MKKKLAILIMLVGIICIGGGAFMTLTSPKEDKKPADETEKNEDKDKENSDQNEETTGNPNAATVKAYSDYTGYSITMNTSITTASGTNGVTINGVVDKTSGVISATVINETSTEYSFYDTKNAVEYYSLDNEQWSKTPNTNMTIPDFSLVIDKIKTDSTITKNESGDYSYNNSVMDGETKYENANITVTFDDNGYLLRVIYNLTSNGAVGDNLSYVITYDFSQINSIDAVSVPEEVVSGATEGTDSSTIKFIV